MKKKPILFCLLCISLAFILLLAGCGGAKEPAPPAPAPVAKPEPEPSQTVTPVVTPTPAGGGGGEVAKIFAKAKQIDGLYYEFIMTAGPEKVEGKSWTKGNKMKNEMTMDGQVIISIMDLDKGEVYMYIESQNMAMKSEIGMLPDSNVQKPTDFTDDIDPDILKIVETTTYEGLKCKVMVLVSTDGHEEMRMWVSEDYGIPLRIESSAAGFKTIMEYKNVKVGNIPDSLFLLPSGVEVIEMGNGGFSQG